MFRTYLYLFCMAFHGVLLAQSPAEAKRNGERAFANERWRDAQMFLAQYQEAKPGDFDVLTKLGISLYQLRRGEEARRYLQYVAEKMPNSQDANLFYYLGRTLHGLGEWEKAINAYKSFLRVTGERHPLRANVIDQIKRCVSGMQLTQNEQVALVENLAEPINSAGDEFAPLPSINFSDRFYYAAARAGSAGGERNDDGLEDPIKGHYCSDMFAAQLKTSGWELQGSLGGLLNTSRFEVPLGFNSNGQILYFFRGFTLYGGDMLVDTAAKKDEYSVESPRFNGPVQAELGDGSPYFFNDRLLLFSSRRSGGQGGLDLWWSMRSDSGWTAPANLGPEVNSAYDDAMPFLTRDGATLFFSSNRLESSGGYDVFKTVFDKTNGKWSAPVNLGQPVNSPENDTYFRIVNNGRTALLSSDRLGGLGQNDIYIVYFKDAEEAQNTVVATAPFTENTGEKAQDPGLSEIIIPTLAFTNDKDLLVEDNQKVVAQVVSYAARFPKSEVMITLHSENSGQPKFDLYTGIKRAEILAKAFMDAGVPPTRLVLRSVGAGFPIAREIVDATPNAAAAGLNRRAELMLTGTEALPVPVRMARSFVSEVAAAPGGDKLDQLTQGISYKVEMAATRQILANDALAMFDDLMIETRPGSGLYQYTAGFFKQFAQAKSLQKEIQAQGFTDASVIAYVNGIRISKAEAVALLKKYPDLSGFIKG